MSPSINVYQLNREVWFKPILSPNA